MKTEESTMKKGGNEKMDLTNKTAQYIYRSYGSSDWRERIDEFSHHLSFVVNEKEYVCKKSLKAAMKAISGIPYKKLGHYPCI